MNDKVLFDYHYLDVYRNINCSYKLNFRNEFNESKNVNLINIYLIAL